jgi:signal transduction histidine kinase/ActR/RegA family two-component response regulator
MALASKVRGEEISFLYRQARAVLWANLAVGAVVAGTLWNINHGLAVALWFGAVLLLTLLRFALQHSYQSAPPATDLEPWGQRFVLASTCSGVLWGSAGVLFFDSSNGLAQALVTFSIAGMTAAAAGTLACHLRAFFGYFLCALLPLTLRTFLEADSVHVGMGLMLIAYAFGMQYVARNNHRSFVRAFQLGLENAELVEQLSRSRSELQDRVEERTTQLEQQSEALRRAQRLELVGQLAGSLAHDFNNLLTVVLSNMALLKDRHTADDQRHAAADETLQAARRGAGLIRQLLSFSHRQRTEPRVFAMNQLISSNEALVKRLAGENIETTLELGPEPSFVRADPAQMEQVLINLVSAACAAMPHGGALQVRTQLDAASGGPPTRVVLYVEDSSDGTKSRPFDGSFDPFPASASEALDQRLGLAAARAIIEQSDGSFEVTAASGQGTRFCVSLPASQHSPLPTPITGLSPKSAGATILVVDDEMSLRSVIRRTLSRDGFNVLVAEDGERALALSRSYASPIHLLITDVVMPGLSGPDLASRLVPERPNLGVLFISGYSFEEVVPATDSSAGTAYLAKPFDSTTLSSRVRQLLEALERRGDAVDA